MTPGTPDESHGADEQKTALPNVCDSLTPDASATPSPPIPKAGPEDKLDTKIELDRVETYLKGPTVFTA